MVEADRNLLQQIGRTGRALVAAFEFRVGHPLPRWRILRAMSAEDGMTQKSLAKILMMDPGSLTRQMKLLEAEGLVRRRTDPDDNRLTRVALTEEGRAVIVEGEPLRQAFFNEALGCVEPEQLEAAMSVLQTLEAHFGHVAVVQ
ncbi:MarR family winged helix-turn-helix transcriptional regulator [Paludibacterium yongneupense]|uniref:MarR family winged helix-turn-helix transcriptional regulator n=1 Tax=Paludibacterium yongneupense TaxID=400061 RepID=UPI00041EAF5B|nr:MarR family transcriptional regulator [Paludibacterium yongneupense]